MNSLRKKLILATWKPPSEGIITGKVTVDASQALAYMDALNNNGEEKVYMTLGRQVFCYSKMAVTLRTAKLW